MHPMMENQFKKMIGKIVKEIKEESEGVDLTFEDDTSCLIFKINPGKNSLGCLWHFTDKGETK